MNVKIVRSLFCLTEPVLHYMVVVLLGPDYSLTREERVTVTVMKGIHTTERMIAVTRNTQLDPVLGGRCGYEGTLLRNTELDTKSGGNVRKTNVEKERWSGKTRSVTRLMRGRCLICVLRMKRVK